MPLEPVRGGRLSVRHWGVGPPVLLVHGLGTSAEIWINQIEQLASDYHTIAPDVRGFGASDWSVDRLGGLTEVVDDLIEICDRAGDAVHYVGTSMGGFFGQVLALRRPDLLRSLTLANSAARNVISEVIVQQRLETLRRLTMCDLANLVCEQALAQSADPGLREWLRAIVSRTPAKTYAHFLDNVLRDFDVRGKLAAISTPTLILTGALDRVIPPEYGAELARLIPSSVHREIGGVGHIACAEDPQAFNRIVLGFIDDVDRKRGRAATRAPARVERPSTEDRS